MYEHIAYELRYEHLSLIEHVSIFMKHNYATTAVLDIWMGQAPYLPKRDFFLVQETTNYSTALVLDSRTGQIPYLQTRTSDSSPLPQQHFAISNNQQQIGE